MKIDKQLQDDHSAKLIVELDQETMDQYKKRAATKLASRTKIPGFRPGKAPYDIVVRQLGEEAIHEAAVDLFIDQEYSKILKQADVDPGASGTLESVDSLKPPKFTFRVPLAPSIDLGDYQSIRLPYEWKEPGSKEVDAALEDLRQMYAATENADRAVEAGDYILVDVKSDVPEVNRTGFATFVREQGRDTDWPYNGFAQELVGLKAGESKTLQHKFPKDWEVEDLQGKSVEITATIKTVRSVTLPDLNDDLAKKIGAAETLDGLREVVKKDVISRSQTEYDDQYFVELIDKLKQGADIKFHAQTLEHESEHVLQDLAQRLSGQGMDLETYFKVRNTTREKFIAEEVQPVARKRLERSLILDEVVRREEIQLDNESLDSEYNSSLNNLAMQGVDFTRIRGGRQGKKRVSEAIAMDAANRMITRKALDLLKSIATGNYSPAKKTDIKSAEGAADEQPAEG